MSINKCCIDPESLPNLIALYLVYYCEGQPTASGFLNFVSVEGIVDICVPCRKLIEFKFKV